RSARCDRLLYQEAGEANIGRSRLCAAGGDFRFRTNSHEIATARSRCQRRAGKSRANVAAALQVSRCRIWRVDAVLAARSARERWSLGKILVWRRGKDDFVSAVSL